MTQRREIENLLQVKTALAQKCERLARRRKSKPWQKRLFHTAASYRRQAADLAEKLKQFHPGG